MRNGRQDDPATDRYYAREKTALGRVVNDVRDTAYNATERVGSILSRESKQDRELLYEIISRHKQDKREWRQAGTFNDGAEKAAEADRRAAQHWRDRMAATANRVESTAEAVVSAAQPEQEQRRAAIRIWR